MEGQCDLFPDLKVKRTRASKEYGAFTDKFKTKLTTDDCYTPEPVYNAVRDWCVEKYGLQGREIVRPFRPGSGFLLSDRAAADRAAARKKITRGLGLKEIDMLKELNAKSKEA